MRRFVALLAVLSLLTAGLYAQEKQLLSRDQLLSMSMEELGDLDLEVLMQSVEAAGFSSVDELFAQIMNKSVASASKKEENAFTSPLSTTVITREEMRNWGVTTIEEALRLVPGVIVQEKTNGNYAIDIRGLNNIPDGQRMMYTENQNILLMVDGMNFTDAVMGGVHFEALPISIEDVARIEVVRGASSALYGQNAIQGVINIITDKPHDMHNLVQGNIQAGCNKTTVADVALRKALSEKVALGFSFNLQNRRRHTNEIYLPGNEGDTPLYLDGQSIGNGEWVTTDRVGDVTYEWEYEENDLREQLGIVVPAEHNSFGVLPMTHEITDLFDDPKRSRESYGANAYLSFNPAQNVTLNLTGGYQNSSVVKSSFDDLLTPMGTVTFNTTYANLNASVKDASLQLGFKRGTNNYSKGSPGYKQKVTQTNGSLSYEVLAGDITITPTVDFRYVKAEDYAMGTWYATAPDGDPFNASAGYYTPYTYKNKLYHSRLSGMWARDGGSAECFTVAASLRLDWKLDDWRVVAAYRADKTDNPDRWNHSWQLAVNRMLGDRNFIRLSYGRSTRAALLVNASADYVQERTKNMHLPRFVALHGSDHDLLHIDAVELGWRCKPSDRLLIDAEAYYSFSTDYGSLHSESVNMQMEKNVFHGFLNSLAGGQAKLNDKNNPDTAPMIQAMSVKNWLENVFTATANIQFRNLPYKVNQTGLSLNIDWIVSANLIAKLNANVQYTWINDYYLYDQSGSLRAMCQDVNKVKGKEVVSGYSSHFGPFFGSNMAKMEGSDRYNELYAPKFEELYAIYYQQNLSNNLPEAVAKQVATAKASGEAKGYAMGVLSQTYPGELIQKYNGGIFSGFENLNEAEFAAQYEQALTNYRNANPEANEDAFFEAMHGAYLGGAPYFMGLDSKYILYAFYNKGKGVEYDKAAGMYSFGYSQKKTYALENNHHHKATPNVYGMVGLIWKPIPKLSASAFANIIGQRTFSTTFGEEKLSPRFTMNLKVGYKLSDACEFFVNAHNLFNNEKQEFVYSDRIGGIYTMGVNFGF